MTWWAQNGDTVGKAVALVLTAGLTALAGRLNGKSTRALKAAEAAIPPTVPPPQAPSTMPARPSSSIEVELSAVRIQLSRALLELDERDSALRRVRATAEEDIRRQRATIDQLEAELRRSAATITEERGRAEALDADRVSLLRQIQGGTYARATDSRTVRGTADGAAAHRDRPGRAIDDVRRNAGAQSSETPFRAQRRPGER